MRDKEGSCGGVCLLYILLAVGSWVVVEPGALQTVIVFGCFVACAGGILRFLLFLVDTWRDTRPRP